MSLSDFERIFDSTRCWEGEVLLMIHWKKLSCFKGNLERRESSETGLKKSGGWRVAVFEHRFENDDDDDDDDDDGDGVDYEGDDYDDDENVVDDDEHLGERCSGIPPSLLIASTSPAGVTWRRSSGSNKL